MNPIFTPTLLRQAVRASGDAYKNTPTHRAGEAEGCLIDYGDGFHFSIRGTEFDGSMILFGDALIDGLVYPWKHPVLGWCHKGFLKGRFFPDRNQGGAEGLCRAAFGALAALESEYTIVGHSKGGGQAMLVGGLMTAMGHSPKAIITVDAPRMVLGDMLAKVLEGVPVLHIRVPASPVNKVPFILPWHHGPGEVLNIGPKESGWSPIAHKISNIAGYLEDYLEAP